MPKKTFLAIGECMIEFSRQADGSWSQGFAGDTFNCAWYFGAGAKEESWNTAYFTRLGTDTFSDQMLRFMAANNIATDWITFDETRQPGLYLIETEDGERSFSYWRDRSAARHLADDELTLSKAADAATLIFFSGITLAILNPQRRKTLLHVIENARRKGVSVAFDPNIRDRLWDDPKTMREAIMEAASISDIILPSFEDEQRVFGDQTLEACAARYLNSGAREVAVKNGGDSMYATSLDNAVLLGGFKKVEPLDTTGAGDAFNGTYLAARMAGKGLSESVYQGHEIASAVVLHPGALIAKS